MLLLSKKKEKYGMYQKKPCQNSNVLQLKYLHHRCKKQKYVTKKSLIQKLYIFGNSHMQPRMPTRSQESSAAK